MRQRLRLRRSRLLLWWRVREVSRSRYQVPETEGGMTIPTLNRSRTQAQVAKYALLVATPLLAWSAFAIPEPTLPIAVLSVLVGLASLETP